jgi:SAM-dependent methyltransferase
VDRVEHQLREYYEAEAERRLRPSHGERRREICEGFARLLRTRRRTTVLDVGAGPAIDHGPFVASGIRYVGVDLAIGNAAIAAEIGQHVIPASLFALPFADATFAAGWSMSTFQHVPDERIDDALAEFVRVLSPGAPVTIGLWGGREEIIESASPSSSVGLPRHFTLRSHERIRSILRRHVAVDGEETFAAGASDWEYHVAAGSTPR